MRRLGRVEGGGGEVRRRDTRNSGEWMFVILCGGWETIVVITQERF